jgi:hypothetical protein
MSTTVSTSLSIYSSQITLTISGDYHRPRRGRFDGGQQITPDEPAYVENITAKLGRDVIELDEVDMERAEVALAECGRGE